MKTIIYTTTLLLLLCINSVTACGLKPPHLYIKSITVDTVDWNLVYVDSICCEWQPTTKADTTWARKVQLWLTPAQRDILIKKIDAWLKPKQLDSIWWEFDGRVDTASWYDAYDTCIPNNDLITH